MPIRVLHIIGQISVGGTEKQLLELCRRMNRKDFQFGVCYYSTEPDSMVEEFRETGVKLYYVNKFGDISVFRFFLALRGFIRDFRPDIIHTWLYSPNCWGRLAGLSCGYRRFICSERSAQSSYPWPRGVLEMFLGRRTLYTANTEAVADALVRGVGLRRKRIRVIHNAVDLPVVDRAIARAEVRAELGLGADAPIVLTVGRQTPAKNYPMFYRAAQRVVRQRPDVVFVAAGHGAEEASLKALHERLELGQSVRMLGLRKDIHRLMAAADVFCLCSSWEGFPNVLVEAMASGLPAITTAFAGVREIVDDNGRQLSFLVDIDRDDQMASGILALLADPAGREAMVKAAAESVRRRFSWSRLLNEMERLYAEILSGSAGRINRDPEQDTGKVAS